METKKQLSNYEIVVKGQLQVNLPSLAIFIYTIYCLTFYTELNFKFSVFIGSIVCYIFWSFVIKKWIKWAVIENSIERDRLYKIGKKALLLWNRNQINEVLDNKKKPWF